MLLPALTMNFNMNQKQEVQVLQAFAFSVVTFNDEQVKPRFRRKCRG